MAAAKKPTPKSTTAADKSADVADLTGRLSTLELRVKALENSQKSFEFDKISEELTGYEAKLRQWLKEDTLKKVAGIVAVVIVLMLIFT